MWYDCKLGGTCAETILSNATDKVISVNLLSLQFNIGVIAIKLLLSLIFINVIVESTVIERDDHRSPGLWINPRLLLHMCLTVKGARKL